MHRRTAVINKKENLKFTIVNKKESFKINFNIRIHCVQPTCHAFSTRTKQYGGWNGTAILSFTSLIHNFACFTIVNAVMK